MRLTITIDDNNLYINGKLAQRIEPGEQLSIGGGRAEYTVIVYRKIDKDKKIIKLVRLQGGKP